MTTYIPSLTLPSALFENAAASILLPIAAGTAVGFSTRPKETQNTYLALRQPPLRPPPWVFGPVWTTLYGLMGYGAFRAWTIGVNNIDPSKAALARVRHQPPPPSPSKTAANTTTARSHTLHNPTRAQPDMDATILQINATHRSHH